MGEVLDRSPEFRRTDQSKFSLQDVVFLAEGVNAGPHQCLASGSPEFHTAGLGDRVAVSNGFDPRAEVPSVRPWRTGPAVAAGGRGQKPVCLVPRLRAVKVHLHQMATGAAQKQADVPRPRELRHHRLGRYPQVLPDERDRSLCPCGDRDGLPATLEVRPRPRGKLLDPPSRDASPAPPVLTKLVL